MPVYSSVEVMRKKVLLAIQCCGEVDADEDLMEDDDEREFTQIDFERDSVRKHAEDKVWRLNHS